MQYLMPANILTAVHWMNTIINPLSLIKHAQKIQTHMHASPDPTPHILSKVQNIRLHFYILQCELMLHKNWTQG